MFDNLRVEDPKNKLWIEAFKLYAEAHPKNKLIRSCKSCRKEVLKWIKSR